MYQITFKYSIWKLPQITITLKMFLTTPIRQKNVAIYYVIGICQLFARLHHFGSISSICKFILCVVKCHKYLWGQSKQKLRRQILFPWHKKKLVDFFLHFKMMNMIISPKIDATNFRLFQMHCVKNSKSIVKPSMLFECILVFCYHKFIILRK